MTQPKRNERRKEARPSEILEAAKLELEANGIASCTLANIANRAGISRTTIYLYFKTKQDIFEALARSTVERTIDEVDMHIADHDGPLETLFETVIDLFYKRLVEGDAKFILKALISEGGDHLEIVRFYHDEIIAKGTMVLRKLIDLGVARDVFDPSAQELDPKILVSPVVFAAVWKMVFEPVSKLDVGSFRHDHMAIMMNGLKSR